MATLQELRHISILGALGVTGLSYDEAWLALFAEAGITGGTFNEMQHRWLNDQLGATYSDLAGARNAFAVNQGFADWNSMGTFVAGGFEGILDTLSTSAAGAWSVARRLTADYEGSLIRLRRVSDNAESDFGYDGDGNLDAAAIATWIGGSSARVVTMYDQLGTDHLTMATAGTQPGYDADEIGGLPCADFSAGGRALVAQGAVATAFSGDNTYRVYAGVLRIKSGAASSTFMGTTNADGSKVYNPLQDVANNGTLYANFDGLFNLAGPYETFDATPKNVCLFSAYGADKINLWWGTTKKLDDQTLNAGSVSFKYVAIGCWWIDSGINNSGSCWWSELIAFAADARTDQAAYAADVSSYYGV